jgi:lipopolysaccharide transport protein LptA
MNSIIESLNLRGEHVPGFAGPMLLQSTILILALFTLDFILRRKIRASIRYALWLVLLVKLLLPPSLALPTGLAWWVRSSEPPAKPPVTKALLVTYGVAMPQPPGPMGAVKVLPPTPKLSGLAWALLGSACVSAGLFAWLLFRWRQVARQVRAAAPASHSLLRIIQEAQDAAGLRGSVEVRVTGQAMSPAVCGLFHPVVVLPRSLVDNLPAGQLRAVLLHELIHLRRGDVWVNCAQSLLQLVYWWHPLVWLANTRIRRVREEAVDDAVMVALRHEAETYAPTLLEVAKLAFNRPLASLGLVGILESKSALRQRIERLMNFRPPRRAGLSVVSLLGIAAFTALTVPMGRAQAPQSPADGNREPLRDQSPAVIASERVFNMKSNVYAYEGNVHIDNPKMKLRCDVFTVEQPELADGKFNGATAERNVVIDFLDDKGQTNHATSDKAVYTYSITNSVTNELVVLTGGNPTVTNAQGSITGDPIIWDRITGRVYAKKLETRYQRAGTNAPQIEIESKFIEMPEETAKAVWAKWPLTNNAGAFVLAPAPMRELLKQLESRDVQVLFDGRVTTLAGRQAQIQKVDARTVVEGITNGSCITDTKLFGPVLDVSPAVEPDGYTIQMTVTSRLTEFLGYDQPGRFLTFLAGGKRQPTPRFRLRQMNANLRLRDGDTLVLCRPIQTEIVTRNGAMRTNTVPEDAKHQLLVLVNPRIVDAAGNRIHGDDQTPLQNDMLRIEDLRRR